MHRMVEVYRCSIAARSKCPTKFAFFLVLVGKSKRSADKRTWTSTLDEPLISNWPSTLSCLQIILQIILHQRREVLIRDLEIQTLKPIVQAKVGGQFEIRGSSKSGRPSFVGGPFNCVTKNLLRIFSVSLANKRWNRTFAKWIYRTFPMAVN